MARLCVLGLILAGIFVVQAVAEQSEPNHPVELVKHRNGVADQPASSAAEERFDGMGTKSLDEAAESPSSSIRRLGKHHPDKSVAGGGVIIGGLATAIFAAVFCYIRVTRKRNSVP